jgi:hypothetical protein
VAERIVRINDSNRLHIWLARQKVNRIGDEFRNGVAVRTENIFVFAILKELMGVAVPGHGRHLELLGDGRKRETVGARQGGDHYLIVRLGR